MDHMQDVQKRLDRLPAKLAAPFRQLLALDHLDEESLALILDAGDLAVDPSKLVGFAVGFAFLRFRGVPVHDVIRMSKAQGRPVNLSWSARRWKEQHDRLSRAEALARLAADNVSYDVSPFERRLPASFDGYLIRSSRRLGMERLRLCRTSFLTGESRNPPWSSKRYTFRSYSGTHVVQRRWILRMAASKTQPRQTDKHRRHRRE